MIFQAVYSCKEKDPVPGQLELVKKSCQGKEKCTIVPNRETFGSSECSDTDEDDMKFWLIYSCDGGGKDLTISINPICNKCDHDNPGEETQVDVRGCGGRIDLVCEGGCINVHKVLTLPPLLWILPLAEHIIHWVPLVNHCEMTPQLFLIIKPAR